MTIATAQLASIVLHSTIYGIYLPLFMGTVYVLFFRHRSDLERAGPRPMNRTLSTVAIVLFLLITAHWIIQVIQLFGTFITHDGNEGTIGHHIYFSGPKYIATTALSGLEAIIADMTMVYRLYHVWGRNWRVIIVPIITTVLSTAAGFNATNKLVNIKQFANYFGANEPWDVAFCSLELATNTIVTALIAYRIWSVDRLVKTSSNTSTMPVVAIVVESAGIFTASLVIILVAFLTRSGDLQTIALDSLSPVIGIAFSLIIIRVGLGMATEDRGAMSTRISGSMHFEGPAIFPVTSMSRSASGLQEISFDAGNIARNEVGPPPGEGGVEERAVYASIEDPDI